MDYGALTDALHSYAKWANGQGFTAREIGSQSDELICYGITTPDFFSLVVAMRSDSPVTPGFVSVTGGAARNLPDTFEIHRKIASTASAGMRVTPENAVTASTFWTMSCGPLDPNPSVGARFVHQMISVVGMSARDLGRELTSLHGGQLIVGRDGDAESLY
jgi:hypothetical protein